MFHVLTVVGKAHLELATVGVDLVGLESHVAVRLAQIGDCPGSARAPLIERARDDDRLVRNEKVAHKLLDAQLVAVPRRAFGERSVTPTPTNATNRRGTVSLGIERK